MTTHVCKQFTSQDISLFVDRELSEEKLKIIQEHMHACGDCKKLAEKFSSMGKIVAQHAEKSVSSMDKARIKTGVAEFIQQPAPFIPGLYIKLASFAAIIIISVLIFQNAVFSPKGPSAIVKSVDTDFASVMIIETPNEHTIIWFSET